MRKHKIKYKTLTKVRKSQTEFSLRIWRIDFVAETQKKQEETVETEKAPKKKNKKDLEIENSIEGKCSKLFKRIKRKDYFLYPSAQPFSFASLLALSAS